MTAFSRACSVPWAILPQTLTDILTIAANEHAPDWGAIEALAARRAKRMDEARNVGLRGGVAVVNVFGPIFRHANLMSEVSGATTVQTLAHDFNAALDNPDVSAIVLNVDSPGGEVAGINEFAQMIFEARGKKRVIAYVDGYAASAAYWIASAADEIVTDSTGILGSIGVVSTVGDPSKRTARDIEFVSSQSPKKRPNPTTESGKTQIQAMVDALAEVFVETVARNRGVTTDTVLESFGQGGVMVGREAVAAGLADRVGTFESLITELGATQPKRKPMAAHAAQEGEETMNLQEEMKRLKASVLAIFDGEPGAAETLPQMSAADAQRLAAAEAAAAEAKQQLADAHAVALEAEAALFVGEQVRANRVLPAETATLTAQYVRAAQDDALLPPTGDEQTRLQLLVASVEARPSHVLTQEMTADDKTKTVAADPNAQPGEMSEERKKQLLAMTPTGQAALKAVK